MKIFWSWQSDTGRHFVHAALKAAVKKLKQPEEIDQPTDRSNRSALDVDQGTQGEAGSPDLALTIFNKITKATVFIADVTPVSLIPGGPGQPPKKRNMNPNVGIELGYALHALSDKRVIMVLNTHYGDPDSRPFDIRHERHPIMFHLPPGSDKPTVASVSVKLTGHLVRALRPYINLRDEVPSQQSRAVYFSDSETLATLHSPKRDVEYGYPDPASFYLRLLPGPSSHPNFSRDVLLSKIKDADSHPLRNGPTCFFARNSYGAIAFETDPSKDGLIASSTQVFMNGEIWGIAPWLLKSDWGAQTERATPAKDGQGLYDFRPVFRNRSAMAYAIAYCIHTLEMSALRGWGVAFLGYVAMTTGASAASVLSPAIVATGLGLIGTFASVAGNEAAIRFGRKRLIVTAMLASILIGATIGFVGSTSYTVAAVLITIYGIVIWLDSSSLTAGTAGTAEPSRRGATLAVHSMLGYAGGFVGPLLIGWTLDLSGGMSQVGWGMSFFSVAMLMVLALITFWMIRPRELEGDHGRATEGG